MLLDSYATKVIAGFILLNAINSHSYLYASEKDNNSAEQKNKKIHPCDIAKSITVKIIGAEISASGTIIQKKSNNYVVLTSAHLLISGEKKFKIQTPDSNVYSATIIQRFDRNKNKEKNNDLATLQFNSKINYPVAKFTKSFVSSNQKVFAAGFPEKKEFGELDDFILFNDNFDELLDKAIKNPDFTCDEQGGFVTLILPKSMKQGYQIGYNLNLPKGMSGGPLVDENGELKGINGKHRHPIMVSASRIYVYRDDSKIDYPLEDLANASWAIPIQTFQRTLSNPPETAEANPLIIIPAVTPEKNPQLTPILSSDPLFF